VQASADTLAFDPTVSTNTADLYQASNTGASIDPMVTVAPGHETRMTVTITPTGAPGTEATGTLYVDDFVESNNVGAGVDEVAAVPYDYTVN
jgi:hypothetical protein